MINPDSPTRHKYPLDPRKITKKTITGAIGLIFLLGFLPVTIDFAALGALLSDEGVDPEVGPWLALLNLFFFLTIPIFAYLNYLYQKCYFRTYAYDLTDDYVIIKKGCFAPKEITVPYEKIQDVYVDQDIFDRMFGLYDVHLSTATITSGLTAHIDGVIESTAGGLKEALLQSIQRKAGKSSGV